MRRMNRVRTRPVTGAKRLVNRFEPTVIVTESDTVKKVNNNINKGVQPRKNLV